MNNAHKDAYGRGTTRIHEHISTKLRKLIVAASFLLVAATGVIDTLTSPDYYLSFVYFIPVVLVSWFVGKWSGIGIAIAGGIAWFVSDAAGKPHYSSPVAAYWNACLVLSYSLIIVFVVSALKRSVERERLLSSTDPLTGAANRRYFYDQADLEIHRLQRYRHPFSIAYIDIDNFKEINDTFGHLAGDAVLRRIVEIIKAGIRKTDIIARFGGDEFALLLPQTQGSDALTVVEKIQKAIWNNVKSKGVHVTLSIGLVTYLVPPADVDEMMRVTDSLMYVAKTGGKNTITQKVITVGDTQRGSESPIKSWD